MCKWKYIEQGMVELEAEVLSSLSCSALSMLEEVRFMLGPVIAESEDEVAVVAGSVKSKAAEVWSSISMFVAFVASDDNVVQTRELSSVSLQKRASTNPVITNTGSTFNRRITIVGSTVN